MSDVVVFSPGEALPPPPPRSGPSDAAWATGAAWLLTLRSRQSRVAYQRDVMGWHPDDPQAPRSRGVLHPARGASPVPFFDWCTARGIDPLDATPLDITLWLRWLDGFDLAPATTARRVSAVRRFFRYAEHVARVIDRSPVAPENADLHVVPAPRVPSTRLLTEAEVTAMRRAARTRSLRDGAILAVLYHEALRVSELCQLNVTDARGIDGGRRTLAVRGGKGGKSRTIRIAPQACDEIDAYLADRTAKGLLDTAPARMDDLGAAATPLFLSDTGKRLTRRQVDHIVSSAAIEGGLLACDPTAPPESTRHGKRITPHVLRHAWITHTRDRGGDIGAVQAHAGHSSPLTTQRYDRRHGALDRSPVDLVPGVPDH